MDFGVVGFDGFVGSQTGFASLASDPQTKQKLYGSVLAFRSAAIEGDSRSSKLPKTDHFSSSNTTLLRSNNLFSFSDAQEHRQMLSFSSPKSESIPYRNTGYNNGSLNCGIRGPFTPSQWMELEHQALIYKYISANLDIPTNLLIPIKKALDSAVFSRFPAAFLRPNALGWGAFHTGFSGNSDPEPGRCRRTDGKKWRCSRDAVADQKYCERHLNRGRHRSRKPVEGQAGHFVAGISNNNSTSKLVSIVDSGAGDPNQYLNNSFHSSGSKQTSFLIPKQQISYEVSPQPEFGLVSGDFLLSPLSHKNGSPTCQSFETESRLHHFICPKNQSDRSVISWSGFDTHSSDRTQLSISTPMAASATDEKLTLSALRLSKDFDPIEMGLGVSNVMNEAGSRQANWIPISWESSMGGPLGEVLNHTNNNVGEFKGGSSALSLKPEGWENSSPIGSSPTGVLQKTSFGSVSTSSTGSSPRIHEGGSLCNDLLGQLL